LIADCVLSEFDLVPNQLVIVHNQQMIGFADHCLLKLAAVVDLVESHQFATDFLLPSEVEQGLGVPTLMVVVFSRIKNM
jgi:hypothetical protein